MTNVVKFQVDDLLVEHGVGDDGKLLIRFQGSYLGNYDKVFEIYRAYLAQIVELVADGSVSEAQVHVEELGQTISRAKHAIFAMLQGLRRHVARIVIYAGSGRPEQEEHQRLMRLFIAETSGQTGAAMTLVVAHM